MVYLYSVSLFLMAFADTDLSVGSRDHLKQQQQEGIALPGIFDLHELYDLLIFWRSEYIHTFPLGGNTAHSITAFQERYGFTVCMFGETVIVCYPLEVDQWQAIDSIAIYGNCQLLTTVITACFTLVCIQLASAR
jgi:hypothetical protein